MDKIRGRQRTKAGCTLLCTTRLHPNPKKLLSAASSVVPHLNFLFSRRCYIFGFSLASVTLFCANTLPSQLKNLAAIRAQCLGLYVRAMIPNVAAPPADLQLRFLVLEK